MIRGPLRRLRHDHRFEEVDGGTLMIDRFQFAVLPLLARADPALQAFLVERNALIKRAAEGGASRYVVEDSRL